VATKPLPHQDAPESTEAQKAEAKAEAQRIKLKLKVSGEEIEKDYTPEELTLLAQKGMGAEKKFADAANIQKVFKEFKSALKEQGFAAFSDPAFADLGDVKQIFIDHLYKEFEAEERKKVDPKAYELEQYKAEVEKYKSQEKERNDAAAKRSQEENDKRQWEVTKKNWVASLEKAGLMDNEVLIHSMAQIGREFLDGGLDLNPDLLVVELKNRMSQQNKMLLGGLKGEALISALGPELVNEILQYKVSLVNKTREIEPIKAPEGSVKPSSADDAEKPVRESHYLRNMREFLKGD
jgi:hypothetical protein